MPARPLQILTLCLISILLTGCGALQKKPEPIIVSVERTPIVLPEVDQLKLDPVTWVIVTEDNAQTVLNLIEKRGNDPVIFGLSDKGYENASINQAKTLKLIIQQRAVIEALTEYYIKKNDGSNDSK